MSAPGHNRRALYLCAALHGFNHLYYVVLMPLYLLVQNDLGLASEGRATLLVTVMMMTYFAPSYLMGVWADRFNRRKLLALGLGLNGLGYALLGWSPNYACALASMAIAGIGGGFYHPTATAMISRMFPRNTGRALGVVGSGAGVGFLIGPVYSGWRATQLQPVIRDAAWRTPCVELGLAGVVCAILFLLLAPDEPKVPAVETAEPGAPRTRKPLLPWSAWILLGVAALAFSLRDFAGASIGSLGSLFVQKVYAMDPKTTGLTISALFFAGIISTPIFGHLSDRRRYLFAAVVLALAGVSIALLPHFPRGALALGFGAYGFFFLGSFPMVEAALMDAVPDAIRGRVFGFFITITGVISNTSHWIFGDWVHRLGDRASEVTAYHGAFALMALFVFISIPGLFCLRRVAERHASANARVVTGLPSGATPGNVDAIATQPAADGGRQTD